jgi:hypothetical protein
MEGTQQNQHGTERAYKDPGAVPSFVDVKTETIEKIGERFDPQLMKGDPSGIVNQLSLTAATFAREIVGNLPLCRERSLALTHLEECYFWLNKAARARIVSSNR